MALDDLLLDTLTSPFVLLEDRLTAGAGGRLYCAPKAVVRCDDIDGLDAAFTQIEQGLDRGLHTAGLFSYELGYALEAKLSPIMPSRLAAPLIWMGLFDPPRLISAAALDAAFAARGPPPPITGLSPAHDRAAHADKVGRILGLIEAGDVYQVNLTFPFTFNSSGDPLSLYAALRAGQPVAHGGVAVMEDMTVLSVSPELWVTVENGQATTRPMKGTSARGCDAATDQAARQRLAADPKQRAENLMIVDLLRNDLSRISYPGSVRVPDLFTVETYPGFHALTSTITSRLDPARTLGERVAALFPCGSIVGAPKIRAAEIIRSLEPSARGVYTGALGAIAPNRDMTFNVAIRTAVLRPDGTGRYDVGGGIVADSDPDDEYEEALLKGRVLTALAEDYGLIETFRWSPTAGFVRLGLHLDRMAASASQLGFSFDRPGARAALDRLSGAWGAQTIDQRVRLQLARTGALEITNGDVVSQTDALRVGVTTARLDPGDPFLKHKTTRRAVYDRAFAAGVAAGWDEALFLNHRGQVAEASRHSVFVEIDGVLVTPPLANGLLPGVLRGELIRSGQAIEGDVPLKLLSSRPFRLGNSLHGLRPARLVLDAGQP